MKPSSSFLPCLCALLFLCPASTLHAQRPAPTPSSASARKAPFEYTFNLKASQILQTGVVSGPLFRVRDEVVTDLGINTFAIDTKLFGTFLAHTNSQLVDRIAEIVAMKRIEDVKRSEAYSRAVEKAADRESDAADDAVADYVSPIEEEPFTGIGKFFRRIGTDRETEKDIDADDVREYKAFQSKKAIVMAKTKRDLCRNLGVNPYTTNLMLQRKLDDMSSAIAMGGFKMELIPGVDSSDTGLASAIWRGQVNPQMSALIYGKNPKELRVSNQTALEQMGASAADAAAFLSNRHFTPWQQTQLVTSLQTLPAVAGRDLFVRNAASATTEETDAVFHAGTAQLLARLAKQNWQIARIEVYSNIPYGILRDGSVLLALQWDYAQWSPTAEKCVKWLQRLRVDGKNPPSVTLAITGQASPSLCQEMEKRGFKVLDLQDRGPLN
jgi:hypothetical protein